MVGIITTCFNHAPFLQACLQSVLAQRDHRWRHVVVDDASTDDSWAAITDYAGRFPEVVALQLPENRGHGAAFAVGVAQLPPACGWVLKVDADDTIEPDYVGAILTAAAEDARRNVIFSPCQFIGTQRGVYRYPPFNAQTMRLVFQIPGPSAIRRDVWDAVGGYDTSMRFGEDWDFYIRAQEAVGLVPHQLPDALWNYRTHNGPRVSALGMARLNDLRRYWQGHTPETVLARSRTWETWCASQGIAA